MFVCVHLFILLLTLTLFVQDGATALFIACQKSHDKVVSILVAAKANPDLQKNVSLYSDNIQMQLYMFHVCTRGRTVYMMCVSDNNRPFL